MPIGDLLPGRLGAAAKRLRHALQLPVRRFPMAAPLDLDSFCGTVEPRPRSVTVEEGGRFAVPVRVQNSSDRPWSSHGAFPVVLRATWLDRAGAAIEQPAVRIVLARPLAAGATDVFHLELTALDALGQFGVLVELVEDVPGDAAIRGPAATPIACTIVARSLDDIDYVDLYGSTDLDANHWAIVGPQIESEFDRLGDVKLQQLVELGCTPHSRLLDVGCGTGLLAVAAERFLSDAGAYVGTDIGLAAIEYCRRKYARPNFRFAVSSMTSLPIEDEWFDAVCFYSVFTHTYPDETALLLAEAKRLLAPGGFIVADLFVSLMVERSAGNRGALENNPDHLHRLVDLTGLTAEVISSGPWKRFGERRFYKFTASG